MCLEDCARPKTVEQFHSAQREWCKKLDNHKAMLSKWQENSENVSIRFFKFSIIHQKTFRVNVRIPKTKTQANNRELAFNEA